MVIPPMSCERAGRGFMIRPTEETTPRRVVRQEARHLGDREDHDKVEGELEGRDPLFVLGLPIALTLLPLRPPGFTCSSGTNCFTLSRSGFPNWEPVGPRHERGRVSRLRGGHVLADAAGADVALVS